MSARPPVRQARRGWSPLEIAALSIALVALSWFVLRYGGQIAGTDSLMYFDRELRAVADPFVLNRYSHVYLLAALDAVTGSPLSAMRAFSLVAALSMVGLLYVAARRFSAKSTPLNGAAAVLLLLGSPIAVSGLIAPPVDTTAMIVMLSLLVLYIFSARQEHSSRWILVAFGALLFVGFRTKETLLSAALLIPGLGFTNDTRFSFRSLWQRLKSVLTGLAIGVAGNLIANGIVLHDPLFGFRPADLAAYRSLWSANIGSRPLPGESFAGLILSQNGLLFLLFAFSSIAISRRHPPSAQVVWLVPLALIAITVLFSTRAGWTIVPRGVLPALAAMSLLGSQTLELDGWWDWSRSRRWAIGLGVSLLYGLLAGFGLRSAGVFGFDEFFVNALAPLVILICLAVFSLGGNQARLATSFSILIVPLALGAAGLNFARVAVNPGLYESNARFQHLEGLAGRIDDLSPISFFASEESLPSLGISNNRDELSALVNVALDLRTVRQDFQIGPVDTALVNDLERQRYSQLLITSDQWDWLRSEPQDRPTWRAHYSAVAGSEGPVVLLVRDDSDR